MGVLVRILLAVLLVLATWNPSGWSYADWAIRDRTTFDAVKAFFGVLLFGVLLTNSTASLVPTMRWVWVRWPRCAKLVRQARFP